MWPTRLKTIMLWAVLFTSIIHQISSSTIKGRNGADTQPAEVHSKKPQNDPNRRELLSRLLRSAGFNETNSTDTVISNEQELKSITCPFVVPEELWGEYVLNRDVEVAVRSDDPQDPKPPLTITVDRNSVTARTRLTVDCENRRPVRAVPPGTAGGRQLKVNNYHVMWLGPGQNKHMVFDIPLTKHVPFGPTSLELVTGHRCVHLYWTSPDTMSYWSTDMSGDRQICDPDYWYGDVVIDRFDKRSKREQPDDAAAPGPYRYARISRP